MTTEREIHAPGAEGGKLERGRLCLGCSKTTAARRTAKMNRPSGLRSQRDAGYSLNQYIEGIVETVLSRGDAEGAFIRTRKPIEKGYWD